MSKSQLLKKLSPGLTSPDMSEILMMNRNKRDENKEEGKGEENIADQTPAESQTATETAAVTVPVIETTHELPITQENEAETSIEANTTTSEKAKGEKVNQDNRGRKSNKEKAFHSGRSMDWNNLDTFTKKENVPVAVYGMKSQRLTDDVHKAFDTLANRTGIPAVHIINNVLACFIEKFRNEINVKYPAESL